ncbi:MAG: transposase zinc-binding domain-containing protein, partial [Anaerolineaceae bacterium]|nr:transposase zinc-binding domain-containing protein [Anaerolineaceae bacterium]
MYDDRFSKRYGYWRPVTDEVVDKYLQCGDPQYGFARIRCKECGAEYLRAYSCKCRGFCPSCSKRKSLDLSIFLEEELFRLVPHRHWVWSVPKILRLHFLHHRKLLPKLCKCAWKSVTLFLHESFDRRDIFPGGILVPQTFGGMANWNPHVHALITDACWDREGNQYHMPQISDSDLKVIEELFAAYVFRILLDEDMISEELVERMRIWKHSGFSVYCGEPIEACDDNSQKTLSEYISRAPFSLERMSYNEDSDTVLYRGEHFHPGLARNFDVTDPLEWLARITSHIPKKGAKQIIYYGAYSQAWRGRERRQGILPKVSADEEPASSMTSMKDRSPYSRRRRQQWAALLKKVWDIDTLKCPKCGGQMKVISFIEQPSVIRRILKHLDLWDYPRPPPQPLEMVCEPYADYLPWEDDVPEIE